MKNTFNSFLILLIFVISYPVSGQNEKANIKGAWSSDEGVIIFSGNFFSYALFETESKSFKGTYGGAWSYENQMLNLFIEYNTFDNTAVGQNIEKQTNFDNENLIFEGHEFTRIDNTQIG